MAISGVNLVMGMDNTKAINGIKQVGGAMDDLSGKVAGEMTKKFKTMFSAVAIEQVVQRTGEWANRIEQVSKNMGISNEMLQTLQLLATKTNTPEDAVVGMFDSIGKARQEAINGNQALIQSFQRLGISMTDIMNPKLNNADFASKTLQAIPAMSEGNTSGFEREAAMDITGQSQGTLASIQSGLKGTNLQEQSDKNKDSGVVQSNENISQLSQEWSAAMTSLKTSFTDLYPVVGILIRVFKTCVDALSGIARAVKGVWDIFTGIFTGKMSKVEGGSKIIESLGVGFVFGLGKLVTGLLDIISSGIIGLASSIQQWFQTVPLLLANLLPKGFGKETATIAAAFANNFLKAKPEDFEKLKSSASLTKYLDDWQAKVTYGLKLNESDVDKGGAVADVASAVATVGVGTTAKVIGKALEEGARVVAKVGMKNTSVAMEKNALKLNEYGNRIHSNPLEKGYDEASKTKTVRDAEEAKATEALGEGESTLSKAELDKRINTTIESKINKHLMISRVGSALSAGGLASVQLAKMKKGVGNEQFGAVIGSRAAGGQWSNVNGGETSMLKMGGVFGSGFTNKMVRLSEQQVAILAQIQTNTMVNRGSGFSSPPMTGMGGVAGGI